jgi:uncharacterized membrane protein
MQLLGWLFLGVAALGGAVLLLIACNAAQLGSIALHRFRETTWIVHGTLLLACLVQGHAGRSLCRRRLRALFDHPRFFFWSSSAMLGLFVLASMTQHLSFHTSSHDFSMIDETLHETHAGRFMYSPLLGRSFLSEHWSPILLLLVPLHAAFESPWLLVMVQPLGQWAGGLVLKKILDQEGISRALRNLLVLLYLNHPLQISTLSYVFHMECFLPLVGLLAYLCLRRDFLPGYWLALLGLLSIKEDMGLYVFGLGVWAAVAERRRMLGTLTAAAGLAWTLAALHLWMPRFGLGEEGSRFLRNWEVWGGSAWEIPVGFLRRPLAFAGALLRDPLPRLFLCFGLLPFLRGSAALLFIVPWALNTTSANVQQASLSLHYGAPLLTFGTLAALQGLQGGLFARLTRSRWALPAGALAFGLNVAHFTFPRIPRERALVLRQIRALPPGARVQALPCFFPVLGYDRPKTLLVPGSTLGAEFVLLRTRDTTWPFSAGQLDSLRRTASRSGYRSRFETQEFAILGRAALGQGADARRASPDVDAVRSTAFLGSVQDWIACAGRHADQEASPGPGVYWPAEAAPQR